MPIPCVTVSVADPNRLRTPPHDERNHMAGIGIILVLYGFGSAILYSFDYTFSLTEFLYDSQPWAGILIGIVGVGLIVGGAVMEKQKKAKKAALEAAHGPQQPYGQQQYGAPQQGQPGFAAPQGQPGFAAQQRPQFGQPGAPQQGGRPPVQGQARQTQGPQSPGTSPQFGQQQS